MRPNKILISTLRYKSKFIPKVQSFSAKKSVKHFFRNRPIFTTFCTLSLAPPAMMMGPRHLSMLWMILLVAYEVKLSAAIDCSLSGKKTRFIWYQITAVTQMENQKDLGWGGRYNYFFPFCLRTNTICFLLTYTAYF